MKLRITRKDLIKYYPVRMGRIRGCMKDMPDDKKTSNVEALYDMDKEDFELYIYSLRKMAENNMESNRTFMTNLYNLRAFQYKAQEEMIANPGLKFAMIVLDFSNFKSINEFCSRDVGDGLLKATADALRSESGEHVVLSHFRADIFAIFTPFEEERELVDITERIGGRISEYKMPYKALPAFGICIADYPAMSVSLMRDYATMALGTIKGKFYAKYAFFDTKMRKQMLVNKMIENDIVDALEEEQLCIFIQPKVNISDGRIIGGEALVRRRYKDNTMVSPGEFIPVVERNGLIIDVDIYVWTRVFCFIGRRLAEGKRVEPISINISRLHVFDTSFKDTIINLSKKYNVPPEYVPLELTESGFSENQEVMYDNMDELRSYGFTISMDDFGIGYSTMTMLKDQPVDEIKIDKGFIDDIENPKSRSILRHTVQMLKELDLDIIVEGVENEAQKDFLLECGCTNAQGYLYYKPMPVDKFEKLLDEGK